MALALNLSFVSLLLNILFFLCLVDEQLSRYITSSQQF